MPLIPKSVHRVTHHSVFVAFVWIISIIISMHNYQSHSRIQAHNFSQLNWLQAILWLTLWFGSSNLYAAECLDVFSSGTQTTDPGLILPSFETTTSNNDVSGSNLNLTNSDYNDVNVNQNGTATFSSSNDTYRLNKLQTEKNATVIFNAPGDYYINQLQLAQGTKIEIAGTGTVRLYSNDISLDKNVDLANGFRYLVIISYSDVSFDQGVEFDGVLFADGDVTIDKNANITGAMHADNFDLGRNTSVTYDPEYINNADFNGTCGPVASTLDHIEIDTDGSALTCTSETITVRACANADCSIAATEDISVTLSVTGGNASIDTNPILIPANTAAGVSVTLTDRVAETVTVGVSSSTPAATGALICSNTSCNITFSETGYLLNLPNQSSCGSATLSIQAVRLSDTGQSCAPVYTGNQSVDFSFDYSNPVTGTLVPVLDGSPMSSATVIQNRTINFDATASANVPFSYADAGQLTVTVADGGDNGLTSSNVTTTVTPAKLLVFSNDANSSCIGPDYGNCSAFKTAGVPGSTSSEFSLVVAGACADDSVTANFQMSGITLTPTLVAPAGGTNASLGVIATDITSNGLANVTQTISEVGAFSITATPGTYFGESIPAATSETIGRFTPARLLIADNSPMLADATCDFTYQGQETIFEPGLAPEITVTAVNSAGASTRNYGGSGVANNDFWKLVGYDFSTRSYSNQASPYPGSLSAVLSATTVTGNTDYDGVNTFSFDADSITHNKAGVTPQTTNDAPFDAEVLLTLNAVSLTDSDGIFYDNDNNGAADAYNSTTIDGTNIRWGRWSLENGFGSELQAIAMNATAQYFDGTQFITAATDSCTPAVTLTLSNYSDNLSAGETTASQTAISSGILPISLSAPGAGNTGSVLITITTPSWLQYDYDNDGAAEAAQGTATFGIYQGRKPVIIKRQTY